MSEELDDVYITAVNRERRIAVDRNNDFWTITHFFDPEGDECEPAEAVSCVIERGSEFSVIDLSLFSDAPLQ